MAHVPVLLHESVDALALQDSDIYVDATLGAGGHAKEVRRRHPGVQIIGFDLDENAIAIATQQVSGLTVIRQNFRTMKEALTERGIVPTKVLFDLGVSSLEFGPSGRGFSFLYDEPLLMTLRSDGAGVTARDLVNGMHEEELADIIFTYGEERYSRRIAKAIVLARKKRPIQTTFDLVEIITSVIPRRGKIHPATRTFQALRIATNDELGALEEGVRSAWDLIPPGGRIAVISFHSLEDRIVKRLFKSFAEESGLIITKKPITPTREEVIQNPRSRSAKLRIIQK